MKEDSDHSHTGVDRAYFVVSDVHLCDVEDHADGWKAYKSARFVADADLDDAVADFLGDGPPSLERIVVLNGDIIDFDLVTATPDDPPWPVSRTERRRGMNPTEAKSAWKLQRILDDHPVFVGTLVRVLAAGHRVVYVMGNHDMEFHFDAVKRTLTSAILSRAEADGTSVDLDLFQFEPWFFHVPGEFYAEHGQQYDYYTSFRWLLAPTIPRRREPTLALPMGNLSNRELMSEMGFFNPHASNYILNVYRYVAHWLRHYAFTRRSIAIRWLFGSIAVLLRLIWTKRAVQRNPPDHEALLEALAERLRLPLPTVQALDRLQTQPITNRWYRVVREFWIDRVIVTALMAGVSVALLVSPLPLWVKLTVPLSTFPLLFLIYESFAHGDTIFSAEHRSTAYAREIAGIIDTRVVTFGHSHTPLTSPVAPGVTYVNTGTWAPIWKDACHELAPGLRNILIVRVEDGQVRIALNSRTG